MYAIIQKDDIKSRCWASATCSAPVALLPVSGSPFHFFYRLVKSLFSQRRPNFVVVRYLNDYPSLFKTLLRALTEIFTLKLCRLLSVKIVWICHNLDKETRTNHRFLSQLRRKFLTRIAWRILVTDDVLMNYIEQCNIPRTKVRAISFGAPPPLSSVEVPNASPENRIKSWLDESPGRINIFVGGTHEEKTVHFSLVPWICEQAEKEELKLNLVVCCASLPLALRKAIERGGNSWARTLVVSERFQFDEAALFPSFDYNLKVYSDLSTPYSIYATAYYSLPLLTFGEGVIEKFIKRYSLGLALPLENGAIRSLTKTDAHFKPQGFLETHKWSSLKYALLEAVQ